MFFEKARNKNGEGKLYRKLKREKESKPIQPELLHPECPWRG